MHSEHIILPGAEIPHEIFYITPAPIALDGMFFQVNRAGSTSRTPSTFTIRRQSTHTFSVIHCVTAGCGQVTVRDKVYPLSCGDVFLLPAYEAHTYQSDPSDPLGLTWVEFAGSNSAALARHILDLKGPVQNGPVFNDLLKLCHQLFSCVHSRRDLQCSQLLYQMLITLCDSHTVVSDEQKQKKQEILSYIDAHLNQDLSVVQVAQQFGYHPNYFSTLFAKITGESFTQYLIYRRISHACRLLITTDLPIQTIAVSLGFFDVSHFYRHFKRICGVAPAKYRRENRGLIHG